MPEKNMKATEDLIVPNALRKIPTLVPLARFIRVEADPPDLKPGKIQLTEQAAQTMNAFFTGTVVDVGPEVETLKVGDKVAWPMAEKPVIWYGPDDRTLIMHEESIACRVEK